MPRLLRGLGPGTVAHCWTRGLARRTIFENRGEADRLIRLLAECVERGWIEVRSFCVMTNHLHVVAKAVDLDLSSALQYVLSIHAQRFNYHHGRDGALFRGRFGSKRIQDDRQLHRAIRYVDFNPVAAGIVEHPALYSFGSAALHASPEPPTWILGPWLRERLRPQLERGSSWSDAYSEVFGIPLDAEQRTALEWWLERQRSEESRETEALPRRSSSAAMRFHDAADLADGKGREHHPLVPSLVEAQLLNGPQSALFSRTVLQGRRKGARFADLARIGLFKALGGLTFEESEAVLGVSLRHLQRLHRRHREQLAASPEYAEAFAQLWATMSDPTW